MENAIKVIVSGLDNAGKTSILTALKLKYDFRKEVMNLKPTIRVEYQRTKFLGTPAIFWDMGGQEKYRKLYQKRKEIYFGETDLVVYVIDIQDRERFESSLNYFDSIVQYFIENEMDVPIIVTFHKYDPEVRTYEEINEDIMKLKEKIEETYPSFNILFQQTSIYDVISIVQLISYGLSVFDNKFFELSLLLETHLGEFDCTSLVLFDRNGIIISEFYNESIDPTIYTHLIESIKEHLFILKRMDEEEFIEDHNFFSIENDIISYLHQIYANDERFFISILIKEDKKEPFLLKFSEFRDRLTNILESLTS